MTVEYKDIFTDEVLFNSNYNFQEDEEKGVYIINGKFKAIFDEKRPSEDPNSVEVVINVVKDFNLKELNWTKDKLILWAKEYVQAIKEKRHMVTIDESNPFVLSFAHLVRWVSAKFRDFHFYQIDKEGESKNITVIFCSFLDDEVTPVFWYPKWSVEKSN